MRPYVSAPIVCTTSDSIYNLIGEGISCSLMYPTTSRTDTKLRVSDEAEDKVFRGTLQIHGHHRIPDDERLIADGPGRDFNFSPYIQ